MANLCWNCDAAEDMFCLQLQDILVSLDDKYLYFSNWIRGWALLIPLLSSAVYGSQAGRE